MLFRGCRTRVSPRVSILQRIVFVKMVQASLWKARAGGCWTRREGTVQTDSSSSPFLLLQPPAFTSSDERTRRRIASELCWRRTLIATSTTKLS